MSKPTNASVTKEMARSAVAKVNVALPATLLEYDPIQQRATVQIIPCFRRKVPGKEDTDEAVECYRAPPIPNVPVLFPGGGLNDGSERFSITWPLQAGTRGVVVFADRSMDEWLQTDSEESEPLVPRRHDLTDAIFVPGLSAFVGAKPAEALEDDSLVVFVDTGKEIRLGSRDATDPVALSSLTEQNITTFKTAITAGITAALVAVPLDPGWLAFQASYNLVAAGLPLSTGATKVKAE